MGTQNKARKCQEYYYKPIVHSFITFFRIRTYLLLHLLHNLIVTFVFEVTWLGDVWLFIHIDCFHRFLDFLFLELSYIKCWGFLTFSQPAQFLEMAQEILALLWIYLQQQWINPVHFIVWTKNNHHSNQHDDYHDYNQTIHVDLFEIYYTTINCLILIGEILVDGGIVEICIDHWYFVLWDFELFFQQKLLASFPYVSIVFYIYIMELIGLPYFLFHLHQIYIKIFIVNCWLF